MSFFINCYSKVFNTVLYDQIASNYFIYYRSSFTRFGENFTPVQPSVVDIVITNTSLHLSPIETHPEMLYSDHVPISCHIFGSSIINVSEIPQYKSADWNSIKRWVDNKIKNNNIHSAVVSRLNVEHLLSELTKIVQSAIKLVPVGKTQPWQKKLSTLTLYLIGQRNKFKRRLQRANNITDRITISCILKQLRIFIDHNVLRDRNNSWSKFIRELPPGNKKFWRLTKAIRGNNVRLERLTVDGVDVYDNNVQANIIADVFEANHRSTINNSSTMDRKVNSYKNWISRQVISNDIR